MAAILVVEDETDLCNVIRDQLAAEGHDVYQAFDGPSALAVVERHALQLVILDLMLPGLDGLTVCRRIRASHLMPMLVLTARSSRPPLVSLGARGARSSTVSTRHDCPRG
jgi:DNA-binding response OmpR family regulator